MPGPSTRVIRRLGKVAGLTRDLVAQLRRHMAVTDAAVDRLQRLRAGEQVEFRSGRDTAEIWQRMDQLESGGYGFYYLHDGPGEWRVQVTRRPLAGTAATGPTAQ